MAERKVIDCDGCEKKALLQSAHISLAIDRCMDAAGSMDTENADVDLCIDCLKKELLKFLKKHTYEENKMWIRNIKFPKGLLY